jgi:protoporphyrinogen oxidase
MLARDGVFDVAIVGAGVTGLVAGRELARRSVRVALIEKWPDVGGQASAFDLGGGVFLERYYHHLFESDSDIISLHEELLPGRLEWRRSNVGMYANGRIWPFVSPLDLLRYGPLPLVDRIRLGLATLLLMSRVDWERMDEIAAVDWLRRVCGERALTAVWRPLLFGKFGADADTVPLAWMWSKLTARRRLRGRGAGEERLGYPRDSFQPLARKLRQEIESLGGRVFVDRPVLSLERRDGVFRLPTASSGAFRLPRASWQADGDDVLARSVVLTTAMHAARTLFPWPHAYASALAEWRYRTAVVLLLELRRPLSSTYWLNIADPEIPFLGLIEHTNFVPAARYPARYAYVSNYVASEHPLTRLSTEELLARFLPGLRRIAPGLRDDDIQRRWSFREDAAQPVPRLGMKRRLLAFDTPIGGIFLANTTQIYPEDRGTNYSVRLGRRVADHVDAWFTARGLPRTGCAAPRGPRT